MSLKLETIQCPTCGERGQKQLFRKGRYLIMQCLECGLAFVNPRRKNCGEIYSDDTYFEDENYYYDYEGNKAAYQKGFRSKLQVIAEYCPSKGKLLDVGAAYGFFMEEAIKFGFTPFGVELSKKAAVSANRFGQIFAQPFSEIATEDRFSVVTFIDSLEHFDQPLDGLRKAWEILEEDGVVAVMVPNVESAYARIMRERWNLVLPEEHLFYFTPRSAKLMLEQAGFKVVSSGTGSYGRSAAEILRVLTRGKVLPIGRLEKFLKKITLEINLGDLFVIARKVE